MSGNLKVGKNGRQMPAAHRSLATNYIELRSRSAFSFLEGASTPEELIAACVELKMPAMALLDRNGLYGVPRFHLAAEKVGIKAHIGAEISVQSPKSKVQSPAQNKRTLDVRHWSRTIKSRQFLS